MFRARFFFDVVFPALIICWTAVLVYSAIASDTGYHALASLETEVEEQSAELEALRERRLALEKRADLLNSRSLDPDLADERIRRILGYTRPGDIVLPRRELEHLLNAADPAN